MLQRIGQGRFRPTPGQLYEPLQALYRAGYRRELIAYIRRVWSLWTEQRGLTVIPEHWWFDPKAMPAGAVPHAWATYPIEFFTRILLGLHREAVAWRRLRFEPDVGAVTAAAGCVPTPLGHVEVAWRRTGNRVRGRLTAPRGMAVTLSLGDLKARRIGPFTERFDAVVDIPRPSDEPR